MGTYSISMSSVFGKKSAIFPFFNYDTSPNHWNIACFTNLTMDFELVVRSLGLAQIYPSLFYNVSCMGVFCILVSNIRWFRIGGLEKKAKLNCSKWSTHFSFSFLQFSRISSIHKCISWFGQTKCQCKQSASWFLSKPNVTQLNSTQLKQL